MLLPENKAEVQEHKSMEVTFVLKKIISLLSAAAMLMPLVQLSASASDEPLMEMHTIVVAGKNRAEAGEVVDFYVKADTNFDEPICGLSFNLDIPEGLEYVEGSFTVTESTLAQFGLNEYDFKEDGDLPYYFYAAATEKTSRSKSSGEGLIAQFKCKVDDDAKGVYGVNTQNNNCVYLSGERAERSTQKNEAGYIRVGVPDDEPIAPERPGPSEDGIYRAYIGYADADWSVQNWDSNTAIKEGENSITFKLPHENDGDPCEAEGVSVLVIDLLDCLYTVGYVRVTSIAVDGEEIDFYGSKIIYGADDHSTADNYRIEIFSYYGDTVNDPPIDRKDIRFKDELTVNFIVSSDRLAEDDRLVYGNIISGTNEDGPVPLDGCKVNIFNDNGSMLVPTVTGNNFDIKMPRGHYSVTVSKPGYVSKTLDNIDIGKTIPESLKCIELNVYGDVNGDTAVDVEDAVSVIMHTTGSKALPDEYKEQVADCDFNNEVDIVDVVTIINQINGVSVITKK